MGWNELAQLAEFVGLFEGRLLELEFDPDDPVSVEAAVRDMETLIDARAADFRPNAAVQQAAEALKAQYRDEMRGNTLGGGRGLSAA